MQTTLIVMSGLPVAGKSTVAERLSVALSLPILAVDLIAVAMWAAGIPKESTGAAHYKVARAVAAEQLRLGLSVIIDAVNAREGARQMWRSLATEQGVELRIIECVCSDPELHRQRVQQRRRNIPGMAEATWEWVEEQRSVYKPWADDRLVLDTSQRDIADLAAAAIAYVTNGHEASLLFNAAQ
jgi:predicted kinase